MRPADKARAYLRPETTYTTIVSPNFQDPPISALSETALNAREPLTPISSSHNCDLEFDLRCAGIEHTIADANDPNEVEEILLNPGTVNPPPWGLKISHRWWLPGTVCTPGEEVFLVNTFNRQSRRTSHVLNLSPKQMVFLDHHIRYSRYRAAQTTSQWATSVNGNPFTRRHAARAKGHVDLQFTFSRNALKEDIYRQRNVLQEGFAEVSIAIDKFQIIESIECGKEVKYRWNPEIAVVLRHLRY